MGARKKQMLSILVIASCVLLPSCPPTGSAATFPYYVTNLTDSPLTQLKFPDGDTLVFENVLDSPVPRFKMRIIRLSRAKFGDTLSELEWRLEDNTNGSISARITVGPGELGFIVRPFNNGIVANIYEVDDDAKELSFDMPGQQ
ncbi:MAG: hypothetical protein IT366_19995 [Candidatus Hydrogenedentes bacterium]|nr:hypothetical protein [Candidatus Hydrogenedentota bacterium]